MDKEKKFSYPKYYKYSSYFLSLIISVGFIALIILGILEIVFLFFAETGPNLQRVFYNLMIVIFLPIVATTVINYWQEFSVSSRGIEFQVFIFWRKFIPWSEVVGIKKSYLPWAKYHIVITKRLTFLHRIIGLLYGFSIYPAFIFNSTLKDYDVAVKTIQKCMDNKKFTTEQG